MPSDFTNRPFDKLRKKLVQAAASPAPPPASKEPAAPSDDDLFADAMCGVQEIAAFRVLPCAKRSSRTPRVRENTDADREALDILGQIASGRLPINLSVTQEYIEWTNPDARKGLAEELHGGRFAVEAMLDLHGVTGDEVHGELDRFLDEAAKRGFRCVKIIHGRGLRSLNGPVLKDAVVRRLSGRYRKRVIAFVSARQCDGGLGAMYVLLQRP